MDPIVDLASDAVGMKLMEQAAVTYLIKGLREVHYKSVYLLPSLQGLVDNSILLAVTRSMMVKFVLFLTEVMFLSVFHDCADYDMLPPISPVCYGLRICSLTHCAYCKRQQQFGTTSASQARVFKSVPTPRWGTTDHLGCRN